MPAASTRSSLLPGLNDEPLSRAGDRCSVEYRRWPRLRSRTGSTFQSVNGGNLWKLTSAASFPPPRARASNVHGSHFSQADDEQITLPWMLQRWVLRERHEVSSDFQPSHDGYKRPGGRWRRAASPGGAPAVGPDGVALVRPCISLSSRQATACAVEVIPLVSLLLLRSREVYLDLEQFENRKFMWDKHFRHVEGLL